MKHEEKAPGNREHERAASWRELRKRCPRPADRFRLMFGQAPLKPEEGNLKPEEKIEAPFDARFQPTRTDNLRPSLIPWIGKTITVTYAWMMDDDDPFPGKIAYMCLSPDWPGYWIPEHDLKTTAGTPLHTEKLTN